MNHVDANQAPYTVCNSSLSEYGVLGEWIPFKRMTFKNMGKAWKKYIYGAGVYMAIPPN